MSQLPSGPIVIDASFLVGLADQERDASRFLEIRSRATITAINFGEVLYKLAQRGRAPAETEQIFVTLGIRIDEVSLADVRHFPDLKKFDAASRAAQQAAKVPLDKIKSLSIADMTCLGYALERHLPVLTGDQHWLTIPPLGLNLEVHDFRDASLTL